MRPFSDLVKGFPRLMRDLSIQYHKQVNLTIEGKTPCSIAPLLNL